MMNKDAKDKIEAVAGGDIPIFTVGDMRLLNLKIPTQLADAADDAVMVAPRAIAESMFAKALVSWRIPEEEAAKFTSTADAFEIMRVLQIHQYLRLVFPNTQPDSFVWLHTQNSAFEDKTPWSVFRDGGINTVFKYLDDFVFGGWSPYINPMPTPREADDE